MNNKEQCIEGKSTTIRYINEVQKQLIPVNDASKTARNSWLAFVGLSAYLLITIASVSHEDLLINNDINLPIISVKLPIDNFFIWAPIIFLLIHASLLVQHTMLSRKLSIINKKSKSLTKKERKELQNELNIYAFTQRYIYINHGWFINFLLWCLVAITFVFIPFLIFFYFQITFLPIHNRFVTGIHTFLITIDVVLIFFYLQFFKKISLFQKIDKSFPETQYSLFTFLKFKLSNFLKIENKIKECLSFIFTMGFCLLMIYSSFFIYDKAFDNKFIRNVHINKNVYIQNLDKIITQNCKNCKNCKNVEECKKHNFIYLNSIGIYECRDNHLQECEDQSLFNIIKQTVYFINDLKKVIRSIIDLHVTNKDFVPDKEFIITYKNNFPINFLHETSINLRKRNLNYSDISRSDLHYADLFGAQLQGAKLLRTNLQNSNMAFTDLRGSLLIATNLQNANLVYAQLQGVRQKDRQAFDPEDYLSYKFSAFLNFRGADLENSNFSGADLSNADLNSTTSLNNQFNGTNFNGANLTSTDLSSFTLKFASFKGADLRGAILPSEIYKNFNTIDNELIDLRHIKMLKKVKKDNEYFVVVPHSKKYMAPDSKKLANYLSELACKDIFVAGGLLRRGLNVTPIQKWIRWYNPIQEIYTTPFLENEYFTSLQCANFNLDIFYQKIISDKCALHKDIEDRYLNELDKLKIFAQKQKNSKNAIGWCDISEKYSIFK